jgi:hypothetical protein
MNRADPVLLEYMKYHIDNVDPSKGETYEKAKKFGQILIDNCELSALNSLSLLELAVPPPVQGASLRGQTYSHGNVT